MRFLRDLGQRIVGTVYVAWWFFVGRHRKH